MTGKGKFLTGLTLIVVCFVAFCGILVVECGLFDNSHTVGKSCILLQQTTVGNNPAAANAPAKERTQLKAADFTTFSADNAPAKTVILGASDPKTENADTGFKFQLELSSKGAAVRKATFGNGPDNRGEATGFDDRDYEDPQPLMILSPVQIPGGGEALSMANTSFVFVKRKLQLPLDRLHWKSYDVERDYDGSQTARFEAVIKDDSGEPVIRLTKAYKVAVGSYLLDCRLTMENLSSSELNVRFNLAGPIGLGREGVRGDMRKAVGGFRDLQGQVTSVRLDAKRLSKAKGLDDRRLTKAGANFLWAAATNKYFAALLVPVPDEGKNFCDWVADKTGRFYNPDGYPDSGDETIGVDLKIASVNLAAVGRANSEKTSGGNTIRSVT